MTSDYDMMLCCCSDLSLKFFCLSLSVRRKRVARAKREEQRVNF